MTLTLSLPSATLDQLRTAANSQGLNLEAYAAKILQTNAALTKMSFREILAPLHAEVEKSGASAAEVDQLIDEAIAESRTDSSASR